MLSHILVAGGLIYVGITAAMFLVIFVLMKMDAYPAESESDGVDSAMSIGESLGVSQYEFTELEIARLVTYRNAVRAGYFTEEIEPRAAPAITTSATK